MACYVMNIMNTYPNLPICINNSDWHKYKKNKNDNMHKNEVQQIRWSDEYWQYRVFANITEYQN